MYKLVENLLNLSEIFLLKGQLISEALFLGI